MKKLNNRGFMLAETLIVTVFVLGIFIMIYRNSIPLISEYQSLSNYDDLDTIYAANLVKQAIVKDANFAGITATVNGSGYKDLSNCDSLTNQALCTSVKSSLGLTSSDKIIIAKYEPTALNSAISSGYLSESGNRAIKDYITYITSTYNQDETDTYRVIISRTYSYQVVEDGVSTTKTEVRFANVGVK